MMDAPYRVERHAIGHMSRWDILSPGDGCVGTFYDAAMAYRVVELLNADELRLARRATGKGESGSESGA